HNDPPKPATFQVQIRTEPAGAAVTVGGHSCSSPDCRIELPPGRYDVEARLKGYQVAHREIVVDASGPPGVTTVALQPEIVVPDSPKTEPPPVTPDPTRASLSISTGVPD